MSVSPKKIYAALKSLFESNANHAKSGPMKSYMKDHFEFFGIKSPVRKDLLRKFTKEYEIPEGDDLKALVTLMWENPHREFQYSALEFMAKRLRKMDESFIPFMEGLILKKSWWDTVDWLAPNGCGKLFQKFPELLRPTTDSWNESENIWLIRSSIIFQLKYREQTDWDLMQAYILHHAKNNEFFIRKAAGWALRQYSKYRPDLVKEFIDGYRADLSNLTIREGSKYL